MPGQGRLGDKANVSSDAHGCPGCPHPGVGPAIAGSPTVFVNGRPALRVDDVGIHAACCGPNMWTAQKGAPNVFINGKAAFRMNDQSRHCGGSGKLIEGSADVIVGDGGGGGGGGGGSGGGGSASSGGGAASSGGSGGGAAASSPAPAAAPADQKSDAPKPDKKLVLAQWSTSRCAPEDDVQLVVTTEEHPPGTAIQIALKAADGDKQVDSISGKTTGDQTSLPWKYNHDKHSGADSPNAPSQQLPDYYFEATVGGDMKKSGILQVRTDLKIAVKDKDGRPVRYARFSAKLVGGRTVEGELDGNGQYQIDDVPPGSAHITFPDHKGIDFDS